MECTGRWRPYMEDSLANACVHTAQRWWGTPYGSSVAATNAGVSETYGDWMPVSLSHENACPRRLYFELELLCPQRPCPGQSRRYLVIYRHRFERTLPSHSTSEFSSLAVAKGLRTTTICTISILVSFPSPLSCTSRGLLKLLSRNSLPCLDKTPHFWDDTFGAQSPHRGVTWVEHADFWRWKRITGSK